VPFSELDNTVFDCVLVIQKTR